MDAPARSGRPATEGADTISARIPPLHPTDTDRMSAPLPDPNDIRIAVIGLGYVGLPLAVA
ncbi:MAG: nucleotide sugar dehydrogenase, partial [Luteimonas sp.]|nr:nucleotide sugar dehydrogenase [Luteimonas sp.]